MQLSVLYLDNNLQSENRQNKQSVNLSLMYLGTAGDVTNMYRVMRIGRPTMTIIQDRLNILQ